MFRDLQRGLRTLRNRPYHNSLRDVLKLLGSTNQHPSSEQILELRPLFAFGGPFHLSSISSLHVRHLMSINGVTDWLYWRYKLQQHGNLTNEIDRAIAREGCENLSDEDLERIVSARGLNADELDKESMRTYLDAWIAVSMELDSQAVSLLLHLPVLLGYNNKNRYWDEESVQ